MPTHLLAWLVVLLLLAGSAWLLIWTIRRNRRIARDHPERLPYGKGLALRMSPFAVLLIAGAVWGITVGRYVMVLFAVAGLASFAYELYQRRQPPSI